MFQRLNNSWELVKASTAVLQADKELIIFPIISSIGILLITITFAIPFFLTGIVDAVILGEKQGLGLVLIFFFYLISYFITFFCNTALVGAAMIRLRGGDPTVGDGFAIAFRHTGSIFGYALIAATVGMVLNALSRRRSFLGRLIATTVGMVWNLATFLVVPILVMEEVGPIDAIKRSSELLRKTWGEQIAGNFGINVIFGWLALLVVLAGVGVTRALFMTGSTILIAMSIAFFVMLMVMLGLISSALSGIYVAAVYNYATTGDAGQFFDKKMVQQAFKR
jgi:hypothetical protein